MVANASFEGLTELDFSEVRELICNLELLPYHSSHDWNVVQVYEVCDIVSFEGLTELNFSEVRELIRNLELLPYHSSHDWNGVQV